jgi:uncharacterized membrane protein
MDFEPWVHLGHIIGAVIWVGGGVMLSLVGVRARRSDDPAVVREFARLLSFTGLRVFAPAVVVVLLTGLWLVLAGSEWQLDQVWVLLALAAFAVAFLIGAIYLSRSALQLERAATSAFDPPVARAAIGRWLSGYAFVLATLLFALWDMVFKPGTGG